MSYWAAVVIMNLFGGIFFIGVDVVEWIRGNYVVVDFILMRFFMFYVFLLFIVIILFIGVYFYFLCILYVNN